MTRSLVAALAAGLAALSPAGAAAADPPAAGAGGGPPLVTPPLDTPAALRGAGVFHCQGLPGGHGVVVINKSHEGLGSCTLGG